jgi:hypothetical protein
MNIRNLRLGALGVRIEVTVEPLIIHLGECDEDSN